MRNCVICGCLLDSNEQMCSRCYSDANNPFDEGEWNKEFIEKYKDWPAEEPPPHKDDF